MIVSLRSPMPSRLPNAAAYGESGSTQAPLSAPVMRKLEAWGSASGNVTGAVGSAAASVGDVVVATVSAGADVATVVVGGAGAAASPTAAAAASAGFSIVTTLRLVTRTYPTVSAIA